jgi:hypothetical protein
MNDANQLAMLQSLLDTYRTKYYQAEYDIQILQLQAKTTIQELEQRIQELSAPRTKKSGSGESSENGNSE